MMLALLKTQLLYYARQVGDFIWWKLGLSLVAAALAPHGLELKGLALIVIIDLICGVWVAAKTHTLSSAGMRRGVAKMLIYFLFLGVVAIAEHSVLDTVICTRVAIGILLATEVLSVTENLVMLGLPIPYASNVLQLVSNKAANYGVNVDVSNPQKLAAVNDVIYMISTTVPAVRDRTLRNCLGIFVSNYYQFMHEPTVGTFSGSKELAWERVRQAMDRSLIDIKSTMIRESIPASARAVFMSWAEPLLSCFYGTARLICDSDAPVDDKLSRLRDALVLMLFRLIKIAQDAESSGQLLKPVDPIGLSE